MKFIEHKVYTNTGYFEGKIINLEKAAPDWKKILGFEILLKEKVHCLI